MAADIGFYQELLNRRRDRAIAIILGVKEKEIDQYLPSQASAKMRKVVLDQVNDLMDFCADMIRSKDGTVLVNEHFLQKLDQKLDALSNGDIS